MCIRTFSLSECMPLRRRHCFHGALKSFAGGCGGREKFIAVTGEVGGRRRNKRRSHYIPVMQDKNVANTSTLACPTYKK